LHLTVSATAASKFSLLWQKPSLRHSWLSLEMENLQTNGAKFGILLAAFKLPSGHQMN